MTPAKKKAARSSKKQPKKAKAAKSSKTAKKPMLSRRSNKAPQTTRPVPDHLPQPRVSLARRTHALRLMAATDFITDPDAHTILWHYQREDRLYKETIAQTSFETWSKRDGWIQRRTDHWEEIERRIREHLADDYLRRRLEDLKKFEARLETLDAYLQPMVNLETGEVLRDEETGLPRFPLEMPSMDKFMAMYLKLHERIMLMRGEATVRTEQLGRVEDVKEAGLSKHLAEPTPVTPKLSRVELSSMARQLLRAREPALGGSPPDTIDAIAEGSDNEADGSD